MSERIVIDTDVLIDAARGVGAARDTLVAAEARYALCVSGITAMELVVGCRNKAELRALDHFLARFTLLHVDETVSDLGLRLLREYRLSHGLLIPDALIAATAIAYDAPLVSKNQRDYRFLAELTLLPYPDPFHRPDPA